jgi:hypothetical protein
MKKASKQVPALPGRWKFKRWFVCSITALASFAAGSIVVAHLTRLSQVQADSNRVFELRVYHTVPDKVNNWDALHVDAAFPNYRNSIFTTSRSMAGERHRMRTLRNFAIIFLLFVARVDGLRDMRGSPHGPGDAPACRASAFRFDNKLKGA